MQRTPLSGCIGMHNKNRAMNAARILTVKKRASAAAWILLVIIIDDLVDIKGVDADGIAMLLCRCWFVD